MDIHLVSIDPERNRHRSYRLAIEGDLFAACTLVVTWGRIGRPGRQRIVTSGPRATVEAAAARLLAVRRRHGYAEPS